MLSEDTYTNFFCFFPWIVFFDSWIWYFLKTYNLVRHIQLQFELQKQLIDAVLAGRSTVILTAILKFGRSLETDGSRTPDCHIHSSRKAYGYV